MATNQKSQGHDDQDQRGRGSNQESRNNRQEYQGSSNENRESNQEMQGNSNDSSSRRFAGMDDDRQNEIASGKAMHNKLGHARGVGSKEARKAGRKRGLL